jgi:hypothetical protein
MTRFYHTDVDAAASWATYAIEKQGSSSHTPQDTGGNSHTDSIPAATTNQESFHYWADAEQPHDNLDWPTTGYGASFEVSAMGANLVFGQPFMLRLTQDGSIARSSLPLFSPSAGTGIKTHTGQSWVTVNGNGSRLVTDTLAFAIRVTNSITMMNPEDVSVFFSDSQSWFENVNFTPPGGTPQGSGTIGGVGSLSGDGFTAKSGSGNITGIGAVSGDGLTQHSGSGSVSAVGSIDGAGEVTKSGSGDVSGLGSVAGDGFAESFVPKGSGVITAVGLQEGAGATNTAGSGSVSGVGQVTAQGAVQHAGSGSLVSVGSLVGDGSADHSGSGSINGVGATTGEGFIVATGSGQVTGIGAVLGAGLAPGGFDPANLSVNIVSTTAQLSWDASPTPGVVDYLVFRRTPQTGQPFDPKVDTPVATGITVTSYDDESLDTGNYDWQVFGRIPGSDGDDAYVGVYESTY